MGELLTDLVKDIWRLFMLVYSSQCNTMADVIAKDAFIDALGDKGIHYSYYGKRAQIPQESLQDCRKNGTLCEEGQAWEQGWVRIQAKGPGRTWLLVPGLL